VYPLTRALVVVIFSLGLLGVSGCSEDNETEAQKLAKTAGSPGAPSDAKALEATKSDLPPPRSSEEAGERANQDPRKRMPSNYSANKKKG
jgi:hypothetical protein